MSPMTIMGSGAARSRTKSHSPRSHTASMSSSQRRATLLLARPDPAGREPSTHELASLPVVGRVHVDHPGERPGVGSGAAGVRERLRVAADGDDVVVGGDAPQPVVLVEVDG